MCLMPIAVASAEFYSVTNGDDLSMCRGIEAYVNANASPTESVSIEVNNNLPFLVKLLWKGERDWSVTMLSPSESERVLAPEGGVLAIIDPSLGMCLGAFPISDDSKSKLFASRNFDFFDGSKFLSKNRSATKKTELNCPAGITRFDIGGLTRGTVDPKLAEYCLNALPIGSSLPVNAISTIARGSAVGVANFERFVDAAGRCDLMGEELEEELRRGLLESRITVNLVVYQMNELRQKGQKEVIKGKDDAFDVYVRAWTRLAQNYPKLVKKFEPIPEKEGWSGPCMCQILGGC